MQIAFSTRFPLPLIVCRHFCLSVFFCLLDSNDHIVVLSKVCDISGQLFFLLLFVYFAYLCMCVGLCLRKCVSMHFMHVTDMGHL